MAMKKISWDETMEYLEILSQISLTEEEKQETAGELKKILAYMEKLEELDTDGVEPMSHVFPYRMYFVRILWNGKISGKHCLRMLRRKKRGSIWCRRQYRGGMVWEKNI